MTQVIQRFDSVLVLKMKHGLGLYRIYTDEQNSNLQISQAKRRVETLKE